MRPFRSALVVDVLETRIDTTDADTVEFKIIGPTLTVAWDKDTTETGAGSLPDHAVHRYFRTPTSCPNDNAPEWYGAFLQANWIQRLPEAGLPLR